MVEGAAGSLPSGAWQTAEPLSDASTNANEPAVAMDEQGNGVAAWHRLDGKGFYIAEAAGYDAAGPLLNSLAIPASGTVGQSLAFSVSPLDVWSALGATTWSFGDGASAVGYRASPTPTARPGTYTVTVTGADVLGNATSAHAHRHDRGRPRAPRFAGARRRGSRRGSRARASRSALPCREKLDGDLRDVKPSPKGTGFHFALSEAASLRIAFMHVSPGLRSGRRCVAPTARSNATTPSAARAP